MKKIYLLLIVILLAFTACQKDVTVTLDGDLLTVDGVVYYHLENSNRLTDTGAEKIGSVFGGDVFEVEGGEGICLTEIKGKRAYYVTEENQGFERLLEECSGFFFASVTDLDKSGRIDKAYINKADILTGREAEDFAFYVFYGRPPKDYGLENGSYIGNVYGIFPEFESLLSTYPVFKFDSRSYSIIIDGEEYLMDEEIVRQIGITK